MNSFTMLSVPDQAPSSFFAPVPLDFSLPAALEADAPPEARGLTRDGVRLLVSYRSNNALVHTNFCQLGEFLGEGDVVVLNTSGTMQAALNVTRADDLKLEVHLSTRLPAGLWLVEVRQRQANASRPFHQVIAGETLHLPAGATVTPLVPYTKDGDMGSVSQRLWVASLQLPMPLSGYLSRYGFPIRYSYVKKEWPIEYYQTVYATEIGSAEMPSAGRAFTAELIMRLTAQGVQIAPLLLHTGVSSLEAHEAPVQEYYRVPASTARLVTGARRAGRRIVAVGTTVVRALETTTDETGTTYPGEGWTDLIVTPQRGIRAVNALLTGFHEPQASHLLMLGALAGRDHLAHTYQEALREGYLWHEFGDLHLLLP
ncbi:MAG TPA: S-adenosylmethionine:tRNA ribosyltransferase-isomerase [Ktedonobacteraceae bacterium]|nr:S-adenosylmethionine:tRNA ribosyltransferase-isomerase [Ktedonobacteraceae bacterium]